MGLLRSLFGGSSMGPRRRTGWGQPVGPRRSPGRYGARPYRSRPRARSRVRVGGCCLPIPIGFLMGLTGAGLAARRLHRTSLR